MAVEGAPDVPARRTPALSRGKAGCGFEGILSNLEELNLLSMTLRLALAMLGGGIIGATRGRHRRAAGMRTHLLVCIGAACTVLVGQYSALRYGGDPMRIPAQVVSGIGFLGAGSILVTGKKHITGLTTAAGLWASACMGLAAGAGYYACAVAMALLIFTALVLLNRLDAALVKASRSLEIYLEPEESQRLGQVILRLKQAGLQAIHVEAFPSPGGFPPGYRMELEILQPGLSRQEAREALNQLAGVTFWEELRL